MPSKRHYTKAPITAKVSRFVPYNPHLTIFSDSLKKIKYDLCARCSYNDLHYLKYKGMTNTTAKTDLIHNNSSINEYLCPNTPFDQQMIDNYFNDCEHGFFHGLCCCIIAYIINGSIDPHTWASIILHDFLKTNKYSQSSHDTQLKTFFNKLHPITYRHARIKQADTKWVLIKSDRIELRRYTDYNQWADQRFINTLANLNNNQQQLIEDFYSRIRPVLLYFYQNRNCLFLRHGYEKHLPPYDLNANFPPLTSYWHKSNTYAVELDTVPLSNQITCGVPNHDPKLIWQDNHCSNHGGMHLWNKIKGFITLDAFKSYGGTLHSIRNRDHLMAKSNIPLKEWIFILQNIGPLEKPIIDHLRQYNIRMVDQCFIFDIFHIQRLLYNRLSALNSAMPIFHQ